MSKPTGREVIYSQQHTDFMPGKAYANPRHFRTPRSDVTKVYMVGDWPQVRAAYEAIGVPVEEIDEAAARSGRAGASADAPDGLVAKLEQRGRVEIPADWESLPFTGKSDRTTMRQIAALVSDTPVLKKVDAIAAIRAELMRRAEVAQAMAGGGETRQGLETAGGSISADREAPVEPKAPDGSTGGDAAAAAAEAATSGPMGQTGEGAAS